MIRSSPQKAKPELLERVVCQVFPKINRTEGIPNPDAFAFTVTKSDELVRFEDAEDGLERPRWREVGSYLCS
jgi:hypothetical protein